MLLSLIDTLPPDPQTTLAVLIVLQFLATLLITALTIWRQVRREPPLHEVYATKKEQEKQQVELKQQIDDLDRRITANETKQEKRDQAIHERINLILAATSRIEGTCRAREKDGNGKCI